MTIEQAKNKIPLLVGQIFGRFKVKGEAPAKVSQSGQIHRMASVSCICGEERIVRFSDLRGGYSTSCGCYRKDLAVVRSTVHGGSRDRLYLCWMGMTRRSRRRGCKIYPAWVRYEGFRGWALSSGYEEHLVLCRNGDVGDYTPTNSRWDTQENNVIEAHAVTCEVTYPDGTINLIRNISEFCRINGLSISSACRVYQGHYKQHKGYKFRRINGDNSDTIPDA